MMRNIFGSITVTEHMEPCVQPFLLGCAISLMLLNSQVKYGPYWTEHLDNKLKRLTQSIRRVHLKYPCKILQPPLLLLNMKLFKMKKKHNLQLNQFELVKVSLQCLLLLFLQKFMRSMITDILIHVIQKNTFESPLLNKNYPSILLSHSPLILLS